MKKLIDSLIKSLFASIYILITISITTAPAKAGEVRTISKNGISLNANPAYGYKHGQLKVSQYSTSTYNDDEQKWELIPSGNNTNLLRNLAHKKCFNSHQTTVGSIPNLYNCDINDDDQKVIVNGGTIIHAKTGLLLNLGDKNDSVVSWKDNNVIRSSYSSREYPKNGNSYTGPKTGSSSGFKEPRTFKGTVLQCTRFVDSVKWIYRDMYNDPNTGAKVFKWSLNIIPSECGRTSRNPTPWQSWEEVVSKTPLNNEGNNVVWDKKWNTSQYWSMYNQYVCHTDFASLKGKYDYNLEPDRVDVGYSKLVAGFNNLYPNFGYECNAPFK